MGSIPAIIAGQVVDDVLLVDTGVHVENLEGQLVAFLVRAAIVHRYLFRSPVVITSGNDGEHAIGSKHYKNEAIDLRSRDLDTGKAATYLLCLVEIGLQEGVTVFDERANVKAQHWHCEVAG